MAHYKGLPRLKPARGWTTQQAGTVHGVARIISGERVEIHPPGGYHGVRGKPINKGANGVVVGGGSYSNSRIPLRRKTNADEEG